MKKLCLAIALGTVLAGGTAGMSSLALAQDPAAATQSDVEGASQSSAERVVERLATKLNLTEDQQQQITPIVAERQEELRGLQADTSMRRMQKARKMKSTVEDGDKKINKILTEEQRKQYAQLKQQMREEIQERRQNRGGSGTSR